jgi:hypothetical protein
MFVGSLQVIAVSPFLAAIFPLIATVALPVRIWPWFDGGTWKLTPGGIGRCTGVLAAVLFAVAAGIPMMFTFGLRPPFRIPVNG